MLLLLVAGEELPGGAAEGQRVLAVKRHPVAKTLGVLISRQLTGLQHAVQVVPGPGRKGKKWRAGVDWIMSAG